MQDSTIDEMHTVWKVSKYGDFSGPYFPLFGLKTRKYGPEKTPYLDTFHTVAVKTSIQNPAKHFFFYNNVYTKLKTNVKKHKTVPRRQYTVCLQEKLKCKNP